MTSAAARGHGGNLSFRDCIADDDASASCAVSTEGLLGARSVALSPDGESVYVASAYDHAVAVFDRNKRGDLTPAGCVEDSQWGLGECEQTASGLRVAHSIAVSPDGESVYVAGNDTVTHFARHEDGGLSFADCVADDRATYASAQVCATIDGVGGGPLVISPDGRSLYEVGYEHAVTAFDLDPAGALKYSECVSASDVPQNESEPLEGCQHTSDGLFGAADLAISPDGRSIYVISTQGGDGHGADAIVLLARDPTTAKITDSTCIFGGWSPGCPGGVGPFNPHSIAVSPDGESVYMTSGYFGYYGTVQFFARDTSTGALSLTGCLAGPNSFLDGCDATVDGLDYPGSLSVSPDGRSVYIGQYPLQRVLVITRRDVDTGELTASGCIGQGDDPSPSCKRSAPVLPDGPLAFSADGSVVYGAGSDAVSVFDRRCKLHHARVKHC